MDSHVPHLEPAAHQTLAVTQLRTGHYVQLDPAHSHWDRVEAITARPAGLYLLHLRPIHQHPTTLEIIGVGPPHVAIYLGSAQIVTIGATAGRPEQLHRPRLRQRRAS